MNVGSGKQIKQMLTNKGTKKENSTSKLTVLISQVYAIEGSNLF